jgi:Fanconi anemia group M protein
MMNIEPDKLQVLTGHTSPSERGKLWRDVKLAFATPQVVERDLLTNKLSLADFSLLIFDESHRAVGNYPYRFIAEQYARTTKNPLILGLTASPGGEVEKIEEVKKNLFIRRVETRTDRDSDVSPYIQPVRIEWRRLKLPKPMIEIKAVLKRKFKEYLRVLKGCGFLHSIQGVSKRELLQVQREIRETMKEQGPNPPSNFYTALVAQAAAFRLCHAMELLETQGLASLGRYLSRLSRKASKPGAPRSAKLLMSDTQISRIAELVDDLQGKLENPKIVEARKILGKQFRRNSNSRAIVFTHYRDSAERVVQALNSVENVTAVKFIGQAKREGEKGLTQREQGEILDGFRAGEMNTLVSTSVGEEGLDIPSVDLVLFYEAVPSGIRLIQRRGRTGRRAPGRVIALLAKGTRDEAFYWSAVRKEKQTQKAISKAGGEIEEVGQKMLEEFSGEQIKIIADHREVPSGVVRELTQLGAEVETRQLKVGDFILSERVGVERKSTQDFLQSMVDKRLIDQAKQLAEAFERPVLILEGEELYTQRGIHPNAIRGALASLAVDYGIPILPTQDEKETARLLFAIARREQEGVAREIPVRGMAKGLTLPEQQRFIVEGLPGVSAVLAKRLLEHFGTVERVVRASEDELREVHGIGKEKAKRIRQVLDSKFKSEE